MNDSQVFDLVNEGGEKIDLFTGGASEDVMLQLEDMYTILMRTSSLNEEDSAFGIDIGSKDDNNRFPILSGLPPKQRNRILYSDWFRDVATLDDKDVYTYSPSMTSENGDYGLDTPGIAILDLPREIHMGRIRTETKNAQQYEIIVNKMSEILDMHNIPYDYMPDTYNDVERTADTSQGTGIGGPLGTEYYSPPVAERVEADVPFLALVQNSPETKTLEGRGASLMQQNLNINYNRYSNIYKKATDQGLIKESDYNIQQGGM